MSAIRFPYLTAGLLTILCLFSSLVQAELTTEVDRNRLSINETLTLTLRYDDRVNSDTLDFDALRQDFEVLSIRPQSSSNVSIINGNYSQVITTVWSVTLAPRHEGTLVIPSFNIQGDVSDAIRIEVTDASSARPQDSPMLVTMDSDLDQAYVGQQILVKVELLAQSQVGNLSGSELRLDNTHLEMLDQRSFRRVENGINWQVVEWQYSLLPEQAGTLSIPPQMFTGSIGGQSSFANPFSQPGRRISARSPGVEIEILPPPSSPDGMQGLPWFPANNVEISASWSGDQNQMRVGEPLTRTIDIVAQGQRASVIPPLPERSSLTYKTYSDQPQLDNQLNALGINGIRRESRAIVPSAEGVIELPEERISWWNANTGNWTESVLPAETINVLPALQNSSFAPPGDPVFLPENATGTPTVEIVQTSWYWPWITGLLGLVVLMQSWILFSRRPENAVKSDEPSLSEQKAWKQLNQTIKSSESVDVRNAILHWARIYFPDERPMTLEALAAKGGDALKSQLKLLDQSLFKGDTEPDFNALIAALAELRKTGNENRGADTELRPLYPH